MADNMTAIETYITKSAGPSGKRERAGEQRRFKYDRQTNARRARKAKTRELGGSIERILGLPGGDAYKRGRNPLPAGPALPPNYIKPQKMTAARHLGRAGLVGAGLAGAAYGYGKLNPDIKGLQSPFRTPFKPTLGASLKDPRAIAAMVAAALGGYGLYRAGVNKAQKTRMY